VPSELRIEGGNELTRLRISKRLFESVSEMRHRRGVIGSNTGLSLAVPVMSDQAEHVDGMRA